MSHEFGQYFLTIMERAADEAQQAGSDAIEAEHLLLAIAAEQEWTTQHLLRSVGLDHRTIRDALDQELTNSLRAAGVTLNDRDLPAPRRSSKRPSRMGASAKLVVERGIGMARQKQDLRPAHLLLGILRLELGTVPRALALAGVDRADLTERVRQMLPGEGKE